MEKDVELPNFLCSRLTLVATSAALCAGDMLRKGFGNDMHFENKEGRHNLVTEWDQKAERLIIESIKNHFPDHAFLAEESGASGNNQEGILWIIDPIDGTVNFVHKIPMFAISIAASLKGKILSAVVYQPLLHELFIAEKGGGAYLNGERLRVTQTAILDSAIGATGFPYNVHENPLCAIDLFKNFTKMGMPIRRIGSAALDLAYLAAGRFDIFWEVSLNPWDYAGGKLLIEEAGGKVTDFQGQIDQTLQKGSILASNGVLHSQAIKQIQTTLQKQNMP